MNIAMNRIMKEFKEVLSNESVRISWKLFIGSLGGFLSRVELN